MAATAKTPRDALSDDLNNYEAWATTAKSTLISESLWDVVVSGIPPDPTKIPKLAAKIRPEELSRWRDLAVKDMKALQVLQSSLSESPFRKSLSASTSKEIWDSLVKSKEQADLARLEKQFVELRMGDRESVDSYFDRVEEIEAKFRRLNSEKSDYEVIKKVLASLSGEYDDLAPVLEELMDVHNMTFKSLFEFFQGYESVTEEDFRRVLDQNRAKSETGMWCDMCKKNDHNKEDCYSLPRTWKLNGSKAGSGSTKEPTPKRGKCFQCGKRGHFARDCNRNNHQKPEAAKEEAKEEEEEEIAVDYLMLAVKPLDDFAYDESMWMIYGHATNHMTPHEKHFLVLDRTYRAKVGLVDGTVLDVEGRGDVKIMMKEGKKKTINNVIFVPGINRNVLSVRQMASRGVSFDSGERGECIVRDRTGHVFGDTTWDERGLSLRLQVVER